MAASPRGLHRITVWWRCNRDRSSILPPSLTLNLAHARARNQKSSLWQNAIAGTLQACAPQILISEIHRVRFRTLVFVLAQHELLFLRNRRASAVEYFLSEKRWRRSSNLRQSRCRPP